MKFIQIFLIVLSSVLMVSCATNYDARTVKSNVWKNFASIQMRSDLLNEKVRTIVAKGAGASKREDIEAAWLEFADKLANGKKYKNEYQWSTYTYRDTMAIGAFSGMMLEGKITLLEGIFETNQ